MTKEDFDIKTEYTQLAKNYNLPNFDDLNKDFEISIIDKKDFISRRIRRRLCEKVIFYCKIIENLIYPMGQNPLNLYEINFISEEDKQNLVKVHKRLMVFERKSLLLDVSAGEEAGDIEYIRDLLKDWPEFKKELIRLVSIIKDSWTKELEDDGGRYFG